MTVTEEDCIPLNFFNKLPPKVKAEIDTLTIPLFDKYIIERMLANDYIINMIYDLSPKNAEKITKFHDDYDYFTALNIYNIIQPVYKELFESGNYYERYPEYLI